MLNNYDRIAAHYDKLSRLVFGQSQVRAQLALLPFITPSARVLIAGGGTGWILPEMAKIQKGLEIDYVEISSKMLDLARTQPCGGNQVTFILSAIEDFHSSEAYDVIMTPFLFDNFSQSRAMGVFGRLNNMLNTGGLWLFTDFHIDKGVRQLWQRALLRSMYVFFRNISHVEANELPDMPCHFQENNYQMLSESYHFGKFIRSAAYRKSRNGRTSPAENKPLVEDHNR